MEKNPFLKHVMKEHNTDIFHSSTYGKAQNGGSMGVASTESFEARKKIEENRKIIKGYGNSSVMGQTIGNGPKTKTYTPPAGAGGANSGPRPAPMPPRNPGISR